MLKQFRCDLQKAMSNGDCSNYHFLASVFFPSYPWYCRVPACRDGNPSSFNPRFSRISGKLPLPSVVLRSHPWAILPLHPSPFLIRCFQCSHSPHSLYMLHSFSVGGPFISRPAGTDSFFWLRLRCARWLCGPSFRFICQHSSLVLAESCCSKKSFLLSFTS